MNSLMTPQQLSSEAQAWHLQLFGFQAPSTLVQQYVALEERAQRSENTQLVVDTLCIVGRQLDVEAIEFVLRLRTRANSLTRKMHTIFYLSEVKSAYYQRYINSQSCHWLSATVLMAFALMRSVLKFLKGCFLLWRYQLV